MRDIRLIMGMPVILEVVGAPRATLERVFSFFREVDERFSTYKQTSEISRFNRGEIARADLSRDMHTVFALADATRRESLGYFDIKTPQGSIDPSGLVKGWAIQRAAEMLREDGFGNFWVEIGGDIQTAGVDAQGGAWSIGIRNPFDGAQIVKVLYPRERGVATSGNYLRGDHIYVPRESAPARSPLVSLTIVGPNVYEADRFATAAFAMGEDGVRFIEALPEFEAYAIDRDGIATMTSGFTRYTERECAPAA